jgi:hypothetical protein
VLYLEACCFYAVCMDVGSCQLLLKLFLFISFKSLRSDVGEPFLQNMAMKGITWLTGSDVVALVSSCSKRNKKVGRLKF